MSFASLFGFNCTSGCTPSDPVTSTVKVNMEGVASPEASPEESLEAQQREENHLQAKLLAEEAERQRQQAERERLEAEERRLEAARRAREEEERLEQERLEEQARVAERERQLREAMEASRAAAEKEREHLRLKREREEQERKAAVSAFLKQFTFSDVNGPKMSSCTGMSKTYPLHVAAQNGDDVLVGMLLKEGANAAQKNSWGKTAAQVAAKYDKKGSHAKVLEILAEGAGSSGKVGGA
eukprot:TRINITY_DN408_c0_g1_i1.p1 TRINITY_DN408_c0_g1~~TRINITY_DN408_c0_g1_i1.p1  ORF type:complete len:262 (-),score=92.93 TRINITY_DN408_c0_g1_i1:196-915(-)